MLFLPPKVCHEYSTSFCIVMLAMFCLHHIFPSSTHKVEFASIHARQRLILEQRLVPWWARVCTTALKSFCLLLCDSFTQLLKALTAKAHAHASIWARRMQVHGPITPFSKDAWSPGFLAYKTYGQSCALMPQWIVGFGSFSSETSGGEGSAQKTITFAPGLMSRKGALLDAHHYHGSSLCVQMQSNKNTIVKVKSQAQSCLLFSMKHHYRK